MRTQKRTRTRSQRVPVKSTGSTVWIRLEADAVRFGHPGILAQIRALKDAPLSRQIEARHNFDAIQKPGLIVNLKKVTL